MQLDCVAQNYAWGIKGEQSAVARFKRASDGAFDVSSEESYAELWLVFDSFIYNIMHIFVN